MTKHGIPKHRIAHCMAHIDYMPEVILTEFPDRNLIFKTIKLARDYVETVMKMKTNCKPLLNALTNVAIELKKGLNVDSTEDKKLKSMVLNRITAITKRWSKWESPLVIGDDNGVDENGEEEEDEVSEEEEQDQ